jgi:ankyrin repeat protein
MYAAENASIDMIRLLLDHGADLTLKDTLGNAALWYLSRNAQLTPVERAKADGLLRSE